ncbi:MAG: hypothetical protein OXL34_18455 [Gemmatimonadota bacterium]|nr:hypothetical protein [Gemmatimonadota bacterium]
MTIVFFRAAYLVTVGPLGRLLLTAWRPACILAAAFLLLGLGRAPLPAQQPPADARPNIFFDCEDDLCDPDYFRTEIPWVNWVRQRQDADVHLIVTSEETGGGGRVFRIDLVGTADADYEDQLVHTAQSTATDRETLDGIAHTMGIGLLRFASESGFGQLVEFVERGGPEANPAERVVSGTEVDDPWNFWVFSLRGTPRITGEKTRRVRRVNLNANASRVTPEWKSTFSIWMVAIRTEIDLPDGDVYLDDFRAYGTDHFVGYALADHWSVGMQSQVRTHRRLNQKVRAQLSPALEYSVFPYEEATRRALTVLYQVGPSYQRYNEETIYEETSEVRWKQLMEVELAQRQPWGNTSVTLSGSSYLHDRDLFRLSLSGNAALRIARGLEIRADGRIAWVQDQIYLSAKGLTEAEALLNIKERAQSFNYTLGITLTVNFGSIYNNVVNNRMRLGPLSFN